MCIKFIKISDNNSEKEITKANTYLVSSWPYTVIHVWYTILDIVRGSFSNFSWKNYTPFLKTRHSEKVYEIGSDEAVTTPYNTVTRT